MFNLVSYLRVRVKTTMRYDYILIRMCKGRTQLSIYLLCKEKPTSISSLYNVHTYFNPDASGHRMSEDSPTPSNPR